MKVYHLDGADLAMLVTIAILLVAILIVLSSAAFSVLKSANFSYSSPFLMFLIGITAIGFSAADMPKPTFDTPQEAICSRIRNGCETERREMANLAMQNKLHEKMEPVVAESNQPVRMLSAPVDGALCAFGIGLIICSTIVFVVRMQKL